MATRKIPSADYLRKLLDYNPDTGILTFKERPREMFTNGYRSGSAQHATWNKRYANKPACNIGSGGYVRVNLLGERYFAHRLIWRMVTGDVPAEVDHINGVRTDNRWCNLRAVDRAGNMQNLNIRSDNTSGVTGVSKCKRDGVYIAYITVKGKMIVLGRFETLKEAADARQKANIQYGFHENHGRLHSLHPKST